MSDCPPAEQIRLVYCPCASQAEAETIARTVVKERLAACANIWGPLTSIYSWQGEICSDQEVALLLKSDAAHQPALMQRVAELHSYDVPAILAFAPDAVPESFAAWLSGALA